MDFQKSLYDEPLPGTGFYWGCISPWMKRQGMVEVSTHTGLDNSLLWQHMDGHLETMYVIQIMEKSGSLEYPHQKTPSLNWEISPLFLWSSSRKEKKYPSVVAEILRLIKSLEEIQK